MQSLNSFCRPQRPGNTNNLQNSQKNELFKQIQIIICKILN